MLLEIHKVQWVARSGQRVWAVDALNGAVTDEWLPGHTHAPGSLVLLRQQTDRPPKVVACMAPKALQAANRHRSADVADLASPGRMVVQAAERLLD